MIFLLIKIETETETKNLPDYNEKKWNINYYGNNIIRMETKFKKKLKLKALN